MDDQGSLFVEVLLPLCLALVMVGIGLTLTVADFKEQTRTKKALVLGVVAQCVLVPLLGFLFAWVFDAPGGIAVGLVLAAATPGGATSNLTAYLSRGNTALGIVLTVLTSFVAILTLPFWVTQALSLWDVQDEAGAAVTVPFSDVLSLLLFIIFVPVMIGLFIKRRFPALAANLERGVSAFSIFVLLFLIIGIMVDLGSDLLPMLGQAGPAAFMIATCACLVAFALGAIGTLDRKDTLAMACEVGIKNITLGIIIGLTVLGNEEMALPSALYAVLMYIPVTGVVWFGRNKWFPGEVTEPGPGHRVRLI